jgi:hypothetical protein
MKRHWIYSALLLTLTVPASAGIIPDPAMSIEEDSLSSAVSEGFSFVADANGGGIFGFYNDTGFLITRIDIDTLANRNIGSRTFEAAFQCNSPFFLDCRFFYNPNTGALRISFLGTNSDHQGIPSCGDSCLDSRIGHFAINLNNPPPEQDHGGWNLAEFFPQDDGPPNPEDPEQRPTDAPTGFVGTVNPTPEPSTMMLLLSSALLGGLALRRRRR